MGKTRKIVSLLVVMTMVFASAAFLSACGESVTPEQKYDAANKNLKNAEDVSLEDGTITASIDMGGQTMDVNMDMDAKYINDKEDPMNMQMAMNLSAKLFGESIDMHMYMKDKTMYTDSNGTKTKTPMDEESMKQLEKYITENADKDMSIADYVTESSEEDGVVTLKLDGQKVIKEAISKLDEEDVDNEQLKQIEKTIEQLGLKTITAKATIEDENFKDLQYSTTLNVDPALLGMGADTSGNTTDKVKIKVTIKFGEIKTNTGLKIDFPDLSDYK